MFTGRIEPPVHVICLIALQFLAGCGQRSDRDPEQTRNPQTRSAALELMSTNDLKGILLPGMKTNEIASKLGQPVWILPLAEGEERWQYSVRPFPVGDAVPDTLVVSVALDITNGHLAYMAYGYASIPDGALLSAKEQLIVSNRDTPVRPISGATGRPTLNVFIVSSNAIPGGRMVDRELLPTAGFTAPQPNLTIARVKEVKMVERQSARGQGQTHTAWAFEISLPTEEAKQFGALTSTNIYRRMLITLDDSPIFCGKIVDPIEDGRIEVTCEHASQAEKARKALVRLQEPN